MSNTSKKQRRRRGELATAITLGALTGAMIVMLATWPAGAQVPTSPTPPGDITAEYGWQPFDVDKPQMDHEVKNIVTACIGYLEYLRTEPDGTVTCVEPVRELRGPSDD